MRTRFVDDLLWLPLVINHHIETTQDQHILNEIIPFIEGRLLNADQVEGYAQSWAIIAGVADPDRAKQALATADARLVDRQARLITLLTPPFNQTPHNSGSIKGYVPGVRENGGQYTHAALWMI